MAKQTYRLTCARPGCQHNVFWRGWVIEDQHFFYHLINPKTNLIIRRVRLCKHHYEDLITNAKPPGRVFGKKINAIAALTTIKLTPGTYYDSRDHL